MTSEKRAQKFHTYDASRHYPDGGSACDWLKLCVAQWYRIWTSQQTPGGRTHISFSRVACATVRVIKFHSHVFVTMLRPTC